MPNKKCFICARISNQLWKGRCHACDVYLRRTGLERSSWLNREPFPPPLLRFEESFIPEPNTGCYLWINSLTPRGYGNFYIGQNITVPAHRFAYEKEYGPIPIGLHIDHLCRVPSCVNPKHLEPVTCKTNILRGISLSALNAKKTKCIHGHVFTSENTYWSKGNRKCKTCSKARVRKEQHP